MKNQFWDKLKSAMLSHESAVLSEASSELTFGDAVIFAENFAKKLTSNCYAILCLSELSSVLGLLSCFAAGKTAVPLSYKYGEKSLRRLFDTINPEQVISDIGGELHTVNIDMGEYLRPSPSPALIMCTSGTTGQPKGAMLSYDNITSVVNSILAYFDIDDSDKFFICRPIYHCAVLTGELLVALMRGAHIHFYGEGFNPVKMLKTIRERKCTVAAATPTVFGILCDCMTRSDESLPLKKIVISGEILSKSTAQKIKNALPYVKKYHVYGLTEASPRVTYLPPEMFDEFSEYAGYPISDVEIMTVDKDSSPCSFGCDGELWVRGPNVMMGYYGNSEMTKKSLTEGWLHTGDRACIEQSGLLKIKGRTDDMIIRAGMNIYPAEIENELKNDPRTEAVLAYGIKDELCGQSIALKIKGNFASVEEVALLCRDVLPEHLIPSEIHLTDDFIINGSGKTKRRI